MTDLFGNPTVSGKPVILPHARATDPQTSFDAARSVVNITQAQQWILDALAEMPMDATDQNIFIYVERERLIRGDGRISQSGARTRRAELVALGKVRDSGKRGKTVSGRETIIWEIVK